MMFRATIPSRPVDPPPATAVQPVISGVGLPVAILTLVFAIAIIGKLYDPMPLLNVFIGLAGVSPGAAKAATVGIVAVETIAVGWLLSGLNRRAAFAFIGLLLSGFTLVLFWQWWAGWTGGCGCGVSAFGAGGDRTFGITRNAACLGLCWLGMRR